MKLSFYPRGPIFPDLRRPDFRRKQLGYTPNRTAGHGVRFIEIVLLYIFATIIEKLVKAQLPLILRAMNRALSHLDAAVSDGADCESMVTLSYSTSLATLNEEWLLKQGPQPMLTRIWREGGILVALVVVGIV